MDSKTTVEVTEVQQDPVCGCGIELSLPAALCQTLLPKQCLKEPSSLDPSPRAQGLEPSSERWEQKEQEQAELEAVPLEPSDASVAGKESALKSSRASMLLGAEVKFPVRRALDASAPCGPGSDDLGAEGKIEPQADSAAEQREAVDTREEVEAQRPNFAGTWDLVRTEGDMDKFLADYGNGWIIRNAAKVLRYGVGRVVLECQQDGDDLKFSRVSCDPSKPKSHSHIPVGQGETRTLGDMGYSACTSLWEGDALRLNMVGESTGLGMTYWMYYNDAGNLVEEMTSFKGANIKNIFKRRA